MVLTGIPQSPNSKHSQIQSPRIKHKWKSKVWKCDVVPDSTSWGQKSKDRILGFLDFPKVVFRISGKTTVWISGNSQVFFSDLLTLVFEFLHLGTRDLACRRPEAQSHSLCPTLLGLSGIGAAGIFYNFSSSRSGTRLPWLLGCLGRLAWLAGWRGWAMLAALAALTALAASAGLAPLTGLAVLAGLAGLAGWLGCLAGLFSLAVSAC